MAGDAPVGAADAGEQGVEGVVVVALHADGAATEGAQRVGDEDARGADGGEQARARVAVHLLQAGDGFEQQDEVSVGYRAGR